MRGRSRVRGRGRGRGRGREGIKDLVKVQKLK